MCCSAEKCILLDLCKLVNLRGMLRRSAIFLIACSPLCEPIVALCVCISTNLKDCLVSPKREKVFRSALFVQAYVNTCIFCRNNICHLLSPYSIYMFMLLLFLHLANTHIHLLIHSIPSHTTLYSAHFHSGGGLPRTHHRAATAIRKNPRTARGNFN